MASRQEERGMREDKMVEWHHWLHGHEFEQPPRVGDGQGSLACCSPWSHKVGHNWATELNWITPPNPFFFPHLSEKLSTGLLPPSMWKNVKVNVKVLVAQLCLTLCNPMDCSPLGSMEFSRQEHWSGLPFPSPGDFPDPGTEPRSPALQVDSLPSEPPGKLTLPSSASQ